MQSIGILISPFIFSRHQGNNPVNLYQQFIIVCSCSWVEGDTCTCRNHFFSLILSFCGFIFWIYCFLWIYFVDLLRRKVGKIRGEISDNCEWFSLWNSLFSWIFGRKVGKISDNCEWFSLWDCFFVKSFWRKVVRLYSSK